MGKNTYGIVLKEGKTESTVDRDGSSKTNCRVSTVANSIL